MKEISKRAEEKGVLSKDGQTCSRSHVYRMDRQKKISHTMQITITKKSQIHLDCKTCVKLK